jgi:hypothetical protein
MLVLFDLDCEVLGLDLLDFEVRIENFEVRKGCEPFADSRISVTVKPDQIPSGISQNHQ